MSAQPAYEHDPDDPAEILWRLPARWQQEFLAEYHGALDAAHEVRQWHNLRELLHRWRLRAMAYSDPGFEASAQETRDARPDDLAQLPGWADRR